MFMVSADMHRAYIIVQLYDWLAAMNKNYTQLQ